MFGRDKQPKPGSGWIDPSAAMVPDMTSLDPELAELMRLEEAERAGLVSPTPAPPRAPAGGGLPDRVSQLQALAELRAEGVLTDAEFEAEKARILSGP